jgi:hypothetical protein
LLELKKASVNQCALPPTYLPYSDLLALQPNKFDVILLDPPFNSSFTWDHLQELPVPSLASDPSFVFLWIGSGAGEGLERGREILAKWGYRRCEDVVWIKTNKGTNQGPGVCDTSLSVKLTEPLLFLFLVPDGPTHNIYIHENKTTLPDGNSWNGQAINR